MVDGQDINLSIDVDGMDDYEIDELINELMNQELEDEEDSQPAYDEDNRDTVGQYFVQKSHNFIVGAHYDQVTICEIGDKLSYTDAMNKAAELA
jgi:hypothetical protein